MIFLALLLIAMFMVEFITMLMVTQLYIIATHEPQCDAGENTDQSIDDLRNDAR